MEAQPAQRLALLETFDHEQFAAEKAKRQRKDAAAQADSPGAPAGEDFLPDRGQPNATDPELAEEAPERPEGSGSDVPPHFFRMMKELALLGYFTSEIGYTQAMRYRETPGRYDPCIPYSAGEPAWAPHL